MLKPLRTLLLSAGLTLGLGASGSAQAYTCLPDTAEAAELLRNYVVDLVTGTDSATIATRERSELPAVSASKVTVVTTTSVCNAAGDAYHTAVTPPGTSPVSRTLAVVKVGTTRYVVLDPNHRSGEFEFHAVFDRRWAYLTGFTS